VVARKIDDKVENARESLEARRATLGDRHPRTLGSINHLASLLQDQGKLDEAAPLFGEALQGFRATLGDRHPDTLSSINNLATLSLAQGRLDEAAALLRENLSLSLATLGDRHPDTLTAINNLRPVVSHNFWLVGFCFGLIHGVGYASVLNDLGLSGWSLAKPLIGFNLGVELAQIMIIGLFLPLAFALRRTNFYYFVFLIGGSTITAGLAGLWMYEQISGHFVLFF
jgi:tetratricopeptide (TPR) repeat protein